MIWRGKQVLVTGAGGFIGSHLVERLVQLGAQVNAFVRYNSRHDIGLLSLLAPEVLEQVEIILGDLRDADAVNQATEGAEVVFHLAALISIPYSYLHPREVAETNILATLNVLMAAKQHEVGKVVHTSTSEVYGTAQYVPIDEKHPLQGQSPYSASKIGADKMAEAFYRSYDLPVAIIRPFNTYGPRQSARAVIPTIVTQALTLDEVRLGDLRPTRDFTYVEDLVEAFLRVAESAKAVGEEINIGSGQEISIGELAQRIFSLMGKEARIVSDPLRLRPPNSEVQRLCADNRKAAELINWRPTTPLDEGLKKTIAWISQNMERYRPGQYQV